MTKTVLEAVLTAVIVVLVAAFARAGSAQWDLNPTSGDWNTAANWTPATVPNGSADAATFAVSNTTAISISANTTVDGITFAPGASSFTITVNPFISGTPNDNILTLSGAGITNNSGIVQKFVTAAGTNYNYTDIAFINSASAGNSNSFTNTGAASPFTAGGVSGETSFYNTSTAANGIFTNSGATYLAGYGGFTNFFDSSTAANGTFMNNGGTFTGFGIGSSGGATRFLGTSTAANGIFTNNAATVSGSFGGSTQFYNTSTAGSGTFTNNGSTVSGAGSGYTAFYDTSSAGNATLIANGGTGGGQGGTILFQDQSTGGTSRVEVFGNGNLDISFHSAGGVTIGSIQGDGSAFLGANNLTVGSSNLSTTFSGVMQDGGQNGGTGGSLTKIGSGTLDLTGANTYTGNTNINGGVLKVDGSTTSNTFVNHFGTLAGTGTVHGNVTNNGTVSPGDALGTLTVNSYTQTSNGTLLIDIAGPHTGQFSVLDVLGNANLNGILDPLLLNGFIPKIGESFTFLDYTARAGEFSSIQNQVFDNGMERWKVKYRHGDAKLTVMKNVPNQSSTLLQIENVPDQASTLMLLTLSLLGLVTYRYGLLRKQA